MSDDPRDETPEDTSRDLDDLIAEATHAADEGVPVDGAAAVDPDAIPGDEAGPSHADEPGADDSEQVDWDTLADLDDRTSGELLAELTAAGADRDGYLDALQRKQAEFDNFRKRMQRDAAGMRITGHAEVATRLLDVLDDFDRTLDNAGDVDETFLKGVTLVHDKLFAALGELGLARIADTGVVFDPNRHEAVQQVPSETGVDEPVVAEVYRPGYELGGRILRPAMVVVEQ